MAIPITPEKAYVRAQRYCAFQERSQQEVRDRLYAWGLHRREVEDLLARLIGDGYLKEERFAEAFVGGKFRIKKWGRIKIRAALKAKQVSEPLIRKALSSIDDAEYRKVLKQVIEGRLKKSVHVHPLKRKHQAAAYAISRGFEPEMVWGMLGGEDD